MIKIKRGLDLPITGIPKQSIDEKVESRFIAILGEDSIGLKPTMAVKVGDKVKLGQLLFSDKQNPSVRYTAPGAGRVIEINRGEKRVLISVVIELKGDESEVFHHYSNDQINSLDPEKIKDNLLQSGLWTAFRTRPYSKVPDPSTMPDAIFVNSMDTNPLAADPSIIINERAEDFDTGLKILENFLPRKIFLCKAQGVDIPTGKAKVNEFTGPHPAGLVGTHIHYLFSVGVNRTVWHLGYQDVLAIARLFLTGQLDYQRIISLAGPGVENPRLVRTRLGASIDELIAKEVNKPSKRAISGSILGGRTARGQRAYLGRYHNQVSVLDEGLEREFMGWLTLGSSSFSIMNIYLSKLTPKKKFAFTTTTNGSVRAMVPIGNYEKILPLDMLPVQLLRSLIVGDTEMAQKLGALELDEEDLALCSFVCAGKYEYGPILRDNLTRIEKEG